MACPFFYPNEKLQDGAWAVAPRVPLGDAYDGECRAGSEVVHPEESRIRQVCNFGYGRGSCDRFPAVSEADAVRFHIAQDSGDVLRVQFILEKSYWPLRFGSFEHSGTSLKPLDAPTDDILQQQAAVFATGYLRRRDMLKANA